MKTLLDTNIPDNDKTYNSKSSTFDKTTILDLSSVKDSEDKLCVSQKINLITKNYIPCPLCFNQQQEVCEPRFGLMETETNKGLLLFHLSTRKALVYVCFIHQKLRHRL